MTTIRTYRFEITKDFAFEAGHYLRGMPEGHKCANRHGHSYICRITLGADDLTTEGFVQDYGDLDRVKRWIDATLDHKFLNDDVGMFGDDALNPTAENLASYIFLTWKPMYPMLRAVAISETAKCWAIFREEE